MSPQSVPVPRVLRRCGSVPCLGLLAAVLAAGCTAGGLPVTSPPTVAPASPTTTAPVITPLPAITPVPAVSPAPPATTTPAPSEIAGPPAAALTPVGADAVAGQLGSFLWQGTGSDAPWLVPPAAQAVHDPGPYLVTFAPSLLVDSWTARWAPIVDGRPVMSPASARAVRGGRAGRPRPAGDLEPPGGHPVCRREPGRLLLAPRDRAVRSGIGDAAGGRRHRDEPCQGPRRGGPQARAPTAVALKIETCASSDSITPKIFCSASRWTQEPQLSK